MWADSHCHIPYEGVGVDAVAEAREAGVGLMVTIGTDAAASAACIEVARDCDGVWATVGLHPHDAVEGVESLIPLLSAKDPGVVAVGECGLDYHYDHSPRDVQRRVFASQVQLAHEYGLTLVVHTRSAWDDTWAILEAEGAPKQWVLHCFSGGPAELARGLEMGAWASFSGIVTFKKADEVRAAAVECPIDRLLIETDSPYLTPVPHRGKPNRPAYVSFVGAEVAALKGLDVSEVEQATYANTVSAFGLNGVAEYDPVGAP